MNREPHNKQILVVVGLVIRDGKVLMTRRSEHENALAHMKWEYPGGKVEFGETPEDAVVREIAEEAGVRVRIKRLLDGSFTTMWEYSWGKQHTIIYGYECEYISEAERTRDHRVMETEWVKIDEVLKRENLPGAEYFLIRLGA